MKEQPLSLRIRLIGTMTMLLVAILLLGGALASWRAERTVATEVEAALDVARNIVRNALVGIEVSPRPHQSLPAIVSIFDGDRHVRATLVDAGGRVIATSRVAAPTQPVPDWFSRRFAATPPPVRVALPAAFGPEAAIVLSPDSRSEVASIWRDMTLGLGVLLAFFLLALAAVVLIVDRAIRPLAALAAPFKRIGSGDYSARVPVEGPSEVARIGTAFNAMVARLAAIEASNRRLAAALATIQEQERADLARDLHDEVGPFLFAIDVDAGAVERLAAKRPADDAFAAEVRGRAAEIRASAGHAHRRVKAVLARLRADLVDRLGLAAAIEDLAVDWRRRWPLIAFEVDVEAATFGPAVDAVAHNIVREAVHNALRHGLPTRIGISVRTEGDYLAVEVQDNGGGFDDADRGGGYGLIGMRERVAALGGSIRIADRDDLDGVVVAARLPVGPPADLNEHKGADPT